jgi:hypothetical protein
MMSIALTFATRAIVGVLLSAPASALAGSDQPPSQPVTRPTVGNDGSDEFDKLLKSVIAQRPQTSAQAPKQATPQTGAASVSWPNAPVGMASPLERQQVAATVAGCWTASGIVEGETSNLHAEIRVDLDREGIVRRTTIIDEEKHADDVVWHAFAERAARIFVAPNCSKLPIPPDKYDQFKTIVFNFLPLVGP